MTRSTMASIFGKKNNSHRQSFLGLGGGGINNAPTVPHPLHVMATKTVTVPLCSLTTLGEKQVSEASHNQAQALSHRANHLNSHPARCQETQQTQTSLSWDCISPWPALSVGFGLHKTSKKLYHEIYNRKKKNPLQPKTQDAFYYFQKIVIHFALTTDKYSSVLTDWHQLGLVLLSNLQLGELWSPKAVTKDPPWPASPCMGCRTARHSAYPGPDAPLTALTTSFSSPQRRWDKTTLARREIELFCCLRGLISAKVHVMFSLLSYSSSTIYPTAMHWWLHIKLCVILGGSRFIKVTT